MQQRMEKALHGWNDLYERSKIQELAYNELQSVISSPIFIFLSQLLTMEDIALIIYEFLNITYCFSHKTHFPNDMESCFKCITSQTTYYDKIIYKFHGPILKKRRKREVDANDAFLQLNFHEDDQVFKRHLLDTISPHAHISILSNENISKQCYFVLIRNNCWNEFCEIRDCKQRDRSLHVVTNLVHIE